MLVYRKEGIKMEEQRALSKAKGHLNNALSLLKADKKAASINQAITDLECAKAVLELLIPTKERARKKGGDAIEGT